MERLSMEEHLEQMAKKLEEEHSHITQEYEEWDAVETMNEILAPPKLKRSSNYGLKINKYFITLTSHPEQLDPNQYYKAIVNILKQKLFKTEFGYGCIELTPKTKQPHAHIYMECKAYVRLDKLKRQWKHSSIDIKKVIKDNGIKNYIDKDDGNDELLTYLRNNSCQRTYSLDTLPNKIDENEDK